MIRSVRKTHCLPAKKDGIVQVQRELGITDAISFDLTAACSGFVLGLITAAQFIHTGARKNVLVIGADALSRYVDWNDRGPPRTHCYALHLPAPRCLCTSRRPEPALKQLVMS